jgi:hypothetical protein
MCLINVTNIQKGVRVPGCSHVPTHRYRLQAEDTFAGQISLLRLWLQITRTNKTGGVDGVF